VRARVRQPPCIEIQAGRHPVVQARLAETGAGDFIANDCRLDARTRLQIITGPNMGGKSTYMRQVALIVLLASMGSYVPARFCRLGPIDAIHTRIGAADDLANAQSTFMMEMTEAAAILHSATEHSLVLMDEIGRGTSTFDGLALASAIAAQLHDRNKAFTLFATHYFELTEFPRRHERAVNVHVSAAESGDDIVFLHAIEPGPASRSYGVQVARLAGMPPALIRQARATLEALETQAQAREAQVDLFAPPPAPTAPVPSELEEALGAIDPDALTPARPWTRSTISRNCRKPTHDLLRRHPAQRRAGVPVRLPHQCGRGRHQHLPQDDRLREAGRPLHGADVGRQPQHLAVGAGDPAGREAAQWRRRADHHLERQEHVRRHPGAGRGRAPRLRAGRPRAEGRRHRLQLQHDLRRPDRARPCACSWSIRPATSSRPPARPASSRSARASTASPSWTGCSPRTPLDEAAKCALVSMDSTLKSNLSVGLPLDLLVYEAGQLRSDRIAVLDEHNPYFQMIHTTWGQRLREVFESIDDPQWDGAEADHPLLAPSERFEPMRKIAGPDERSSERHERHAGLLARQQLPGRHLPATAGPLGRGRPDGAGRADVRPRPGLPGGQQLAGPARPADPLHRGPAGRRAGLAGGPFAGRPAQPDGGLPAPGPGPRPGDAGFAGHHRLAGPERGRVQAQRADPQVSPGKVSQQRRHHWPDLASVKQHFASKPVFARWDPRVLDDYVAAGFVEAPQAACSCASAARWKRASTTPCPTTWGPCCAPPAALPGGLHRRHPVGRDAPGRHGRRARAGPAPLHPLRGHAPLPDGAPAGHGPQVLALLADMA
jgi:hypothetical protein